MTPQRLAFDPAAFAKAVVWTPVYVGLFGLLLVVPAVAVVVGLPAYLLLGIPALRIAPDGLPRGADPLVRGMAAGFLASLGTYPLYFTGVAVLGAGDREAEGAALFCFVADMVAGPILGGLVAESCRRRHDGRTHSVPPKGALP